MNIVNNKYTVSNTSETDCVILNFCEKLKSSTTVLLNGDMGTGKTYVSAQIASFYGIRNLNSSSFQRVTFHAGQINIIHCDFYRSQFNYNFFIEEIEPLMRSPWILLLEWFPYEQVLNEMGRIHQIFIKNTGRTKRTIKISTY